MLVGGLVLGIVLGTVVLVLGLVLGIGTAGWILFRVRVVAFICWVANLRYSIWEVIIVKALKRLPFSVYSLKIASRSSSRVCSWRSKVRVEARTIKSLASKIADLAVYSWVF